jgi:ATP-dependent RNA helicase DDX52/ROK1
MLHNKHNIIASSETGSGKTLSYLIPLTHNIYLNKLKELKEHKVLIILPTKELCVQIANEAMVYSKFYTGSGISVKYLTKSMLESIKTSYDNFLNNNDIIIATPKKALEIIKLEGGKFKDQLLYLILDEADKFFDLGFIDLIDQILYETKDNSAIVKGFFSATLVDEIEEIIITHIVNSVRISIGSNRIPARSIYQKFVYCTNEEGKLIGIRNIFRDGFESPMLIFVEGIHRLKYLYDNIKYDMPKTEYLHSKMSKFEREAVIKKFRCGEIWVKF